MDYENLPPEALPAYVSFLAQLNAALPKSATLAVTVPAGEPMREVCRRERTPGSNLSERVCRQVPVNSSARDRSAGDRLRESQGSRTPQSF